SAGAEAPAPPLGPDVDVLVTHQIVPSTIGVVEALAGTAHGTWLVVSSTTTVAVLWRADTATPSFVARPFAGRGAAGEETAAALDVLLDGLKRAKLAAPGGLRWGVLGPETARAFERYSLPRPIVPRRARLADLIDVLRKANP